MSSVREYADPRQPAGLYVGPHVIIIAIIAAVVLFAAGAFAGSRYTQSYFVSHYRTTPIHVQRDTIRLKPQLASLPASGWVNFGLFPGIGDQGTLGACAAWASTYYDLSYEWRLAHPGSYLRFSPRYTYDHYSDTYNGGQDGGSWPDQDIEVSATTGIPRYKAFPYGTNTLGLPAYAVENPTPQSAVDAAARQRFTTSIFAISNGQGAGYAAVDAVKAVLATGHAVNIALPVFPAFDGATSNPYILSPTPGQQSRGGHEITIVGYSDTATDGHGTTGFFRVRNQWTRAWGQNGDAWLSYDFVARYSLALESIKYAGPAVVRTARPLPPTRAYLPNTAPLPHVPSFISRANRRAGLGAPRSGAWYVHNVRLTTGEDVSATINALGNQFHVMPVAIAATIGTESAFNPNAERFGYGLDQSCGLMQQIFANITQLNGLSGLAACRWEENPYNSLWFGTKILAADQQQHPAVPFYWAYCFYNGGSGQSDSECLYPSGQVASNLYNNFVPNWTYALNNFAFSGPAPKPAPRFNLTNWRAYTTGHHLRAIPYRYRGALSWAASVWVGHQHQCRGVVHAGQYVAHGGYTRTPFAACAVFTWSRFHSAKVAPR